MQRYPDYWASGLRPGTVKPRSAATAAENKPVYSISVYGQDNMIGDTKTHKNEDPISILLPAFDHLVVFFLCSLGVYGEERSRAVTEVRFSLRWRIWCRLRVVGVAICYRHYEISEMSNPRVTHTWVVLHLDGSVSSLRH